MQSLPHQRDALLCAIALIVERAHGAGLFMMFELTSITRVSPPHRTVRSAHPVVRRDGLRYTLERHVQLGGSMVSVLPLGSATPVLRRLHRADCANAVRDLDNIGSALSVSPTLLRLT